MPYSQFTLKKVQQVFSLEISDKNALFAHLPPQAVSPLLKEILASNIRLATAINTEKARSELIIAPVLTELWRLFENKISLFSGIELNVDKERDLVGFCDFILSQSPEQLFLNAPVIMIVEAKNDNLANGLGQCVAEMLASRLFNEQEGIELDSIYGAVTTGSLWKFLKLQHNTVYIDMDEYSIKEVDKITGILSAMLRQNA